MLSKCTCLFLCLACARCEAFECRGRYIDNGVCLVGDVLGETETPINVEMEVALTTYAAWANLSPTAMRQALETINTTIYLEPNCKECADADTVAITKTKPKSRVVDMYFDTWAANWVFAKEKDCWPQSSILHEFLHVSRYIHLVLLTDNYDQYMKEIRETQGHPPEVFTLIGSPESIGRTARVESLCY